MRSVKRDSCPVPKEDIVAPASSNSVPEETWLEIGVEVIEKVAGSAVAEERNRCVAVDPAWTIGDAGGGGARRIRYSERKQCERY